MQRFGINIYEKKKNCASSWLFTKKNGGLRSSEMLHFFFAREATDVSKHRGAFILNTDQSKHVSRLSQYEISESRRRFSRCCLQPQRHPKSTALHKVTDVSSNLSIFYRLQRRSFCVQRASFSKLRFGK